MRLKLKNLMEMPFAEYGEAAMDLKIEKYPLPQAEKNDLIQAFTQGILSAYSVKHKKWLSITPQRIKVIVEPTEVKLPDYWEKYITWSI